MLKYPPGLYAKFKPGRIQEKFRGVNTHFVPYNYTKNVMGSGFGSSYFYPYSVKRMDEWKQKSYENNFCTLENLNTHI